MALTDASKVAIALKKVQGKSQTKSESELYNEPFNSGLSLASNTIFAEVPSTSPSTGLGSVTGGVVEKLRFLCEYIPGTDTISGRHAFKLRLLSDYESTSSNASKSTGSFINSAILAESAGRLQSESLKLITEREQEIESFYTEEFWKLTVNFQDDKKK